jgi:type II secretory pathway component PulF
VILAAGTALLATMLFRAPAYEQMYGDMAVELPSATVACLRTSQFLRAHFCLLSPVFPAAAVTTLVILYLLDRAGRRFAILALATAAALALALYVHALRLPMGSLMESL